LTGAGGKGGSDSSGKSPSFADLADEIDALEPLAPGPRVAPGIPEPGGRDGVEAPQTSGRELYFPDPDEPLLARRSSIRQREFTRLRRGNLPYRVKIDLHGDKLPSARRRVREELIAAADVGETCVLIVHGKGHHSQSGVARLRAALPNWLTDPALAEIVLACAPAQPRDGGRGAVYVMLAPRGRAPHPK
jgi:DNA-nicking Smr family endonuclease